MRGQWLNHLASNAGVDRYLACEMEVGSWLK